MMTEGLFHGYINRYSYLDLLLCGGVSVRCELHPSLSIVV
jgi:hypothetical protein